MLHGSCDAGRIVRFDPFGDVLITKAANCRFIVSVVFINAINVRFLLPPRPAKGRHWIYIFNFLGSISQAAPTLYVGGRNVSSMEGYPLPFRNRLEIEAAGNVPIYGVTDSFDGGDSLEVRTMELV